MFVRINLDSLYTFILIVDVLYFRPNVLTKVQINSKHRTMKFKIHPVHHETIDCLTRQTNELALSPLVGFRKKLKLSAYINKTANDHGKPMLSQ